jgi:hypothetical protein
MYLIDQVGGRQSQIEEDLIDHTIYGQENPRFRMHPEGKSNKTILVVKVSLANSLHDLDLVGIDTCSAVSVSTEKDDFIFVDGSQEARDSVTLRGVGGSSSVIGGRGPMVVKTKDSEGNEVLMFDPSAVYLDPDELDVNQARFRIFGQAKLKRAGLKIVQDKYGNDDDYLVYRNGETEIPMETVDDIITVRTMPLALTKEQGWKLEQYIEDVLGRCDGDRAFLKIVECNSFVMNEANLSSEERARLWHWRQAHRQCGEGIIHENCPICEEGKRKTKGYKRNEEYRELVTQEFPPFHRLYADGYGGQRSLGEESYQGAKGGFVFVCPSSGTIKVKLYATTEQFPAILYQVLQEIETEGYACREIYVDTFKVNFSAAAEEVAAMFRVRLVPVSSGTPQEMAYAESAVRVIGEMSRSLMAGAPHLDESCWGLADMQAAYIHKFMPQQSKDNMSPY